MGAGAALAAGISDTLGGVSLESPLVVSDGGITREVNIDTVDGVGNVVVGIGEDSAHCADCRFQSGSAVITDTGGLPVGVNWGRWSQGGWSARVEGTDKDPVGDAHFGYTDKLTTHEQLATLTGTASFGFVGGTQPTDELGQTGTVHSATLDVDFGAAEVKGFELHVETPGRNYHMDLEGTAVPFDHALGEGVSLIGGCTGCAAPEAHGHASMGFIGPDASHVLTPYAIQDTSGENHAVGVMVLGR